MAKKSNEELLADKIDRLARAVENRDRSTEKSALSFHKSMDEIAQKGKKISDIFNDVVKSSGSYGKTLSTLTALMEKAADSDKLSNKQIDRETKKAIDSIRDSIKANKDLTDHEKQRFAASFKHAKTYDDLMTATENSVKELENLSKIQNNFGKTSEEISANLKELGITSKDAETIIQKTKKDSLKQMVAEAKAKRNGNALELSEVKKIVRQRDAALGTLVAGSSDVKKQFNAVIVAQQKVVQSGTDAAQTLDKISGQKGQQLVKHIDDSTEAFKKNIVEVLSVGYGLKKLKEALVQGAQEFVKINSVGLAGTFIDLQEQTLRYGMSFESLMKITDENRLLISRNAVKNKTSFSTEQSKFIGATVDLAAQGATDVYGIDKGREVAAAHERTVGLSGLDVTSQQGKSTASVLLKNQLKLQKATGESADVTIQNVDQLSNLDEVTSKLVGATDLQRAAILKNISAQYEQYRLMGLSAEQTKSAIELQQEQNNPLKGSFIEKMKTAILGPIIASMQARIAGQNVSPQEETESNAYERYAANPVTLEELKKDKPKYNRLLQSFIKAGKGRAGVNAMNSIDMDTGMPTAASAQIGMLEQNNTPAGISMQNTAMAGAADIALKGGVLPGSEQAIALAKITKDSGDSFLQSIQTAAGYVTGVLNSTLGKAATGVVGVGAGIFGSGAIEKGIENLFTSITTAITTASILGNGGVKGAAAAAMSGAKTVAKTGLKAGGIGLAGAAADIGLGYASDKATKSGYAETGNALDTLGTIAGATGTGAAIGSIVPGIGTIAGAAAGAIVGSGYALYNKYNNSGNSTPITSVPAASKSATTIPPSMVSPQSTGNAASSSIDPRKKKLMDFVAKYESNGSYNKMNGGTELDLEHMTLAQVMSLGKQPGGTSSAAGRYQVVPQTLSDAMRALKLSPTDMFDAATQDKIGQWLLDRRGANSYLAGNMSGGQFASNVVQEWASLKGANGKGAYDGFNGNQGSASYSDLTSTIASMNTASPATSTIASLTPTTADSGVSPIAALDSKMADKVSTSNDLLSGILDGINKLLGVRQALASGLPKVPQTQVGSLNAAK